MSCSQPRSARAWYSLGVREEAGPAWRLAVVSAAAVGDPGSRREVPTVEHSAEEHVPDGIGERLRAIRRQKRLSLQEVEALSEQEFKASVLGAYERGERAISVPRLVRLAQVYGVPAEQLLPREESIDLTEERSLDLAGGFSVDLLRLHGIDAPEAQILRRYAERVQVHRQDFNGRVLTIRSDDVRVMAWALGLTPDELGERLEEMGVRAGTPAPAPRAEPRVP